MKTRSSRGLVAVAITAVVASTSWAGAVEPGLHCVRNGMPRPATLNVTLATVDLEKVAQTIADMFCLTYEFPEGLKVHVSTDDELRLSSDDMRELFESTVLASACGFHAEIRPKC